MPPIPWPAAALAPRAIDFSPVHLQMVGPPAASGMEYVVAPHAGFWRAALQDIPLLTDPARGTSDTILAYRALRARAQGSLGQFLVPVYDTRREPAWRAGAAVTGPVPVLHGDGSGHGDGTGYTQARVVASLAAAVALGSTSATIDMETGESLEAGQYFQLGWADTAELHEIGEAYPDDAVADRWIVSFWPPARDDHADGDAVELDRPCCVMRCTGWPQTPFRSGWSGAVTLEFREVAR